MNRRHLRAVLRFPSADTPRLFSPCVLQVSQAFPCQADTLRVLLFGAMTPEIILAKAGSMRQLGQTSKTHPEGAKEKEQVRGRPLHCTAAILLAGNCVSFIGGKLCDPASFHFWRFFLLG